ncbi:unnamed protein product [Phyllotreta striolata]|nr:unnamed protein product [Phyllotreta striolata]
MPAAESKEVMVVWYDGESNNTRIDFIGGRVKLFLLGEKGNGVSYKITPVTTEEVLNKNMCFQVNGTAEDPITAQDIMPSMEGFEYAGMGAINQHDGEKWRREVRVQERVMVYTMWVKRDENNNTIPIEYEMVGINTVTNSHYDHYYIHYDKFLGNEIPEGTFNVSQFGLKCGPFTGPGNQIVHNFNPLAEFVAPVRTDHVDSRFEEFVQTHGKRYESTHEHSLRKDAFRHNLRFIEAHNRKGEGYTLGVNHLADLTNDELRVKAPRGRLASKGYNGGLPFPYDTENVTVPSHIDWRLLGAVTPIKDQMVCGSCWAFGTNGAMEGAIFIKTGKLISLSEQALVDCSWGYGNIGCEGGEDFRAYQWIKKHGGVPANAEYTHYSGENGYCIAENVTKIGPITGWVNVTSNNEAALKLALLKHGPISVAIDASLKTFMFYSSGVYHDKNCRNRDEDLDHAVLAVGYGTLNGQDYWLVKNSWSPYWGSEGFVLIARKNNICGVTTAATYPVLA